MRGGKDKCLYFINKNFKKYIDIQGEVCGEYYKNKKVEVNYKFIFETLEEKKKKIDDLTDDYQKIFEAQKREFMIAQLNRELIAKGIKNTQITSEYIKINDYGNFTNVRVYNLLKYNPGLGGANFYNNGFLLYRTGEAFIFSI